MVFSTIVVFLGKLLSIECPHNSVNILKNRLGEWGITRLSFDS